MDNTNFNDAIKICYNTCYNNMINKTIECVNEGNYIFLIAKNKEIQELFNIMLINRGIKSEFIYLIGQGNSIDYKYDDIRNYKVIITTTNYSEGYNLTKCNIMITTAYFTNESTREQLEYRINRIGQPRDSIKIITYSIGIISRIYEKYNKVRKLSLAIKDFADSIDIDKNIIKFD
jgi:hypothetical protein